MVNPWALIAFVIAWVLSLGCAAWYFDGAGEARAIARQARDEQVRQKTFDDAQAGAAAAIAKLKPRNTTIRQEVQREIQTDVRYVDCKLTDGVFDRINEALTRGKPAGSSGVSGAAAAR